jgi:protein O-GlcNAc transferase
VTQLPPALSRALALAAEGQVDQAIAGTRSRLRINPRDPRTLGVLAYLLMQSGDLDGGIEHFERALRHAPNEAHAHANLAGALFHRGRLREAEHHYTRALAVLPTHLGALAGIVVTRTRLDDIEGALAAADAALARQPNLPDVAVNRAYALVSAARVADAADGLRQAAKSAPGNRRLLGAIAFLVNYLSTSHEDILACHRDYGASISAMARASAPPKRAAGEVLTVGILSSDLKSHSVGYFLLPALRARPPGFRVVCFSTGSCKPSDPLAAALRAASDDWVDVAAAHDAGIDRAIRSRGIDVVVELNGHTLGNRLTALDARPAPVIVSAIGYPNTTGHPAVGWRVVDSTTDPPGAEHRCTEQLLRIDPCFLCYEPPPRAAAPSMPPEDLPVTFGSFNLAAKIQDETAAAWALVFRALPDARLLLKSQTLQARAASETILARLQRHGIARERVDIVPYTDTVEDHLSLYSRMHVALDTMPYNGTTTTCEALWMGVPVVAIEGDRHASRVSSSLLRAAGCPELVGSDAASFREIAVRVARDRAKLLEYRTGLRSRMTASPLMDAPSYARRFFGALRDAWEVQTAALSPDGSAT